MAKFWYNLVKFKGYPLEAVPEKYREVVAHMLEEDKL